MDCQSVFPGCHLSAGYHFCHLDHLLQPFDRLDHLHHHLYHRFGYLDQLDHFSHHPRHHHRYFYQLDHHYHQIYFAETSMRTTFDAATYWPAVNL